MKIEIAERLHFMRALQSRQFALLWSGQTISRLGDGAYLTALAWQVLILTGSGTAMGIVLVASSLPQIFFLLIGGVVADRLPRLLVLLWSDVGRAIAVLLIAALSGFHLLQLWHLIVLGTLFGIAQGFFLPAYQSIPPQLVTAEALPSANALNGLSRQVGQLLGPLLGAACVTLIGPAGTFAFDGATFVVSALCMIAILPQSRSMLNISSQNNNTDATRKAPNVVVDIREGLGYVMASSWLRVTILIAAVGNVTLAGPLVVALPKLVQDVYHSGVWLLGLLSTMNALGSILGTLLVGQLQTLHRRGLLAYLGLILSSIGILVFGLPLPQGSEPVVVSIAAGCIGLGLGVFEVIWITVLQELVPANKQGRVFSIDALGSFCLLPVGYALVGVLTDHVGPAWVFLGCGLINIGLNCAGLCVRGIRQLN